MNSSDDTLQPTPTGEAHPQPSPTPSQSDSSMQDYYQLKHRFLLVTLALTGIIFVSVWVTYSLNVALNYLLGACTGVVYLRMLAKDVERLGSEKRSLSKNRFALFIGLIIVATRWHQLQIIPIFLGFLTYKAALLVYMVQSLIPSDPKKVK